MRIDRTDRVLKAVRCRIGERGDMHIRVSRFTFRVIMRALGVGDWEDAEDFREVDAVALELLLLATIKARKAEGDAQR